MHGDRVSLREFPSHRSASTPRSLVPRPSPVLRQAAPDTLLVEERIETVPFPLVPSAPQSRGDHITQHLSTSASLTITFPAILGRHVGARQRLEPFHDFLPPQPDGLRPEPYGLRETPCTISTMDCGLAQPGRSHDLGQSHNPGSSRRHADSFPSCPSVSLPARATGGAPPADTQIGRSPAAAVEPPRSGSPLSGTARAPTAPGDSRPWTRHWLSRWPSHCPSCRSNRSPSGLTERLPAGPGTGAVPGRLPFRSAAPRAGTRRWGDPDPARKRIARAHEPDPMPVGDAGTERAGRADDRELPV